MFLSLQHSDKFQVIVSSGPLMVRYLYLALHTFLWNYFKAGLFPHLPWMTPYQEIWRANFYWGLQEPFREQNTHPAYSDRQYTYQSQCCSSSMKSWHFQSFSSITDWLLTKSHYNTIPTLKWYVISQSELFFKRCWRVILDHIEKVPPLRGLTSTSRPPKQAHWLPSNKDQKCSENTWWLSIFLSGMNQCFQKAQVKMSKKSLPVRQSLLVWQMKLPTIETHNSYNSSLWCVQALFHGKLITVLPKNNNHGDY